MGLQRADNCIRRGRYAIIVEQYLTHTTYYFCRCDPWQRRLCWRVPNGPLIDQLMSVGVFA